MRVLFTVHKLPPESLGGTEIYTRSLARMLAALGHEVSIFAPSSAVAGPATLLDEDGVRLQRVPLPATRMHENAAAQFWHTFRDRRFEREFRRYLAETNPDVVHFQHVQGLSARLIALAQGMPRFATLHDYWYFCANSQLVRPDRAPCDGPSPGCRNCVDCATARADLSALRLLRPLVALPLDYRNRYLHGLAQQIDQFFAPSAFLRERYIGQGFPAEKIRVLENGMDLNRLAAGTSLPAFEPPARPHFGFLGTLAWQKGAHVLVDAFNRLPADIGSLSLYGSDSAFPDYAAALRTAVEHPNVTIHPPVAYTEVGNVLRTFDALVVPSLWYENSPLVIQEAYALGVPVIASRLGALAEKVEDKRTGRLFGAGNSAELAEVLLTLSRHPELLAAYRLYLPRPPSMEEHARELVESYTRRLATIPTRPVPGTARKAAAQ